MTLVWTKEEEESRKICEITRNPKNCELETDRIVSGIGYVFMDLVMTELLVSSINIWDVNFKAVE